MTNRKQIEEFIKEEINPGLAMHNGFLVVKAYDEKTKVLQVEMGGGCQGCSSSIETLHQAVETFLKDNFPDIGKVEDITDHLAGVAPHH